MKFAILKRKTLSAEEKNKLNKERMLLILSGMLLGIGFPPFPMPFPVMLLFALIPYIYVIKNRSTLASINRATYLMAFIFNLITIYWVGSWQKQADPFLMISGGLLVFVNPVFFLIPSTLLYCARKAFPSREVIYLLPLFWGAYEYLYMSTDLSFPWLTLGNGLANFNVIIQSADIIGVIGLSVLTLYVNIFVYKVLTNIKVSKAIFIKHSLILLVLLILVFGYGAYRIISFKESRETIEVGLIQPNLNPWEKWEGGNLDELAGSYIALSKQAVTKGAKLIIWPETALPVFLLDGTYGNIVDSIYSFIKKNNVYLLTGMPDVRYYFKGDKQPPDAIKAKQGNYYYTIYNGILLFEPDSRIVQKYGKSKLVPFGERVPFVDSFPFLGDIIKWGVGISGWNVGRDTTNFSLPPSVGNISDSISPKDSIHIDGLVCYESIYPYYISNFVKRGAEIIAVVTNDSWYGNSSGPYQHKDIANLRAVENRRSVIRAANGGISCIIDPLGRTKIQSGMFTKTFIVGDVSLETKVTFFTKYPLLVPSICLVISIWVLGIFVMKKIKVKLKL